MTPEEQKHGELIRRSEANRENALALLYLERDGIHHLTEILKRLDQLEKQVAALQEAMRMQNSDG